jgi:hypothetical protein
MYFNVCLLSGCWHRCKQKDPKNYNNATSFMVLSYGYASFAILSKIDQIIFILFGSTCLAHLR